MCFLTIFKPGIATNLHSERVLNLRKGSGPVQPHKILNQKSLYYTMVDRDWKRKACKSELNDDWSATKSIFVCSTPSNGILHEVEVVDVLWCSIGQDWFDLPETSTSPFF